MQDQFRLDDLLARDVGAQWFEGVAVVQLVCRQLREQGREASGFPRPEHILIGPGGSVTLAGGLDGKPVETAAHVLGLMLGNDVPVRLRLAITQATATESGYASLTEFSEALAYFERPNPGAIVEALRQRAMIAAPLAITPPVRIDPGPIPEKMPAPAPATRRRGVRPLVVFAGFSAVACALIWLIGPRVAEVVAARVILAESKEAPVEHPSTTQAKSAVSPQTDSTAIGAQTTRRVEPIAMKAKSVLPAPPELQVVATTVSYEYPESLPSEPVATALVTTPLELAASDDVVTVDRGQQISDRIYSRADAQVTVPLSVYPRFPNDPLPVPAAGGTRIELTIAANGLVERVRMLTAPRNIHEFMLVSAAKAWRFEPARIDGRPVRFRHVMILTAIP